MFPESNRVKVWKGIGLEYTGNSDKAEELYDGILEKDETNVFALKRKVSLAKSKGKYDLAIERLCSYLETFLNDGDAWYELSKLYLLMNW
jgi:tetratricopeptide (TPR) repeat protein